MAIYKRVLSSILSVLIGAVFIFSAYSKLPSLEQFGWTIVETTFLSWTMAEWSARILIGLEFFLGILFISHIKIKRIAIPLSLFLLSLFTIYLLMVMKHYGPNGNCGCFGELIPMTPLQSVIKNAVLIATIICLAFNSFEFKFRFINLVTVLVLLACSLTPFLWLPPESIYVYDKETPLNRPIPLSLLYDSEINKPPAVELRKGKHIIVFMSLTCEFCRKAAKRLRIMKEKHPELPFYMILNGDKKKLPEFFQDTKAQNIDYSSFNGAEQFSMMNDGYSLPTIKWVSDTTVIRESNYLTLDENEILEWIR